MMIKIDKKAVIKTSVKWVAWITVLAILVILVLTNCDIRSSKDATTTISGKAFDTSKMADYKWTYIDPDGDGDHRKDSLDYEHYKAVYNSENYQLLYHPDDASIIVRDKTSDGYVEDDYSTGYMWTSTVDLSKKPLEKLYELWRRRVSSLFVLHLFDANRNSGAIDTSAYLAGDYHLDDNGNPIGYQAAKMSITEIENGIEATFVFETHFIQVSLRIFMKDDILHVEVPKEGIIEQGNYKISSIDIMPMFGCVETTKTDGYVFYPDGSGAISYFNEENVRETETTYKFKIYGESPGEKQKIGETATRMSYRDIIEGATSGVKSVSLPVYGIREDDSHGYIAIISKGSADGIIAYDPGGYVIELNRIYSTATYRRAMDLSTVGGYGIGSDTTADSAKFESEIQSKDYEVEYHFLQKGETDYSAMAAEYRRYLLKNDLMKDFISDDTIQLGIDLFMGITEQQTLVDNYIAMTSFEDAQSILKDVTNELGSTIQLSVALMGWQTRGYEADPLEASPASGLGGKSGIKALAELCKELNIKFALNVNPVDMIDGNFSGRTDAAYLASNLPLYCHGYGYARSYKSMFESYLPAYISYAKSIGADLNIEKLGWLIYANYKNSTKMSRTEAFEYIQEQLKKMVESGVNYSTESNVYTIGNTGRVTALDYTHSKYDISNEAIPFYQMVIHSYIAYSSAPGNLAHDLSWIELKWAEYGYMPYFILSQQEAAELKYTSANWLYSSKYEQWKSSVIDCARNMNEKLGCVWNSEMVKHEKLDSFIEVYAVRYANGKVVYVNYSDADFSHSYTAIDGSVVNVVIPANDYIVNDYLG